MKTLARTEGNVLWNEWWDELKNEWFKVEVLQDYSGEDHSESLDAWLAGDKDRSIQLMREWAPGWANECREKVERGVSLTRIHVVDYPLSDYVEWEIEVYKNRNIPLGKEDVYLVDRTAVEELGLPAGDFMLFDATRVVVNTYDETGYAYEQTFYDGEDITKFTILRSQLLAAPLEKVTI